MTTSQLRADGRTPSQLRPMSITRSWAGTGEGSALIECGNTRVLCVASLTEGVPRWKRDSGEGWVTAEYSMLPRATSERSQRESVKGKIGGRTHEISRLIGRSLRAIVDIKALGENTLVLDCDVLRADGGTRTASISGAYVALYEAISWGISKGIVAASSPEKVLSDSVSAISVGIIDGTPMLDLPYVEDVRAQTDMNVVQTGSGSFVEVQGTAEHALFSRTELGELLLGDCRKCSDSRPPGTRVGSGSRSHRFFRGRTVNSVRGADAPRLVFATGNAHKVAELEAIIAPLLPEGAGRIARMSDFDVAEPVEDGATFTENSLIKARSLCAATGIAALADDSGLCVDIMGGAPGIFSARWSGAHGNDQANLELLLAQLSDVPLHLRGAAFVSAAALVLPDGREFVELGRVEGHLTTAPQGERGFGYDPIFIPSGMDRTAAQLTAEEKNAISHRGIAFRALAPRIIEVLAGN